MAGDWQQGAFGSLRGGGGGGAGQMLCGALKIGIPTCPNTLIQPKAAAGAMTFSCPVSPSDAANTAVHTLTAASYTILTTS